jgi:hypothetical protein
VKAAPKALPGNVPKLLRATSSSAPAPSGARFSGGFWVDVLQRTALLHPEESLQWQDTVAVIEDLAWSLAPKSDQEDRLQLIGLIPALLTRLNRGLDLIDVERSDRRPFFDALIEVHAVVLRAELTPPPPVPKQESTIEKVNRLQRGDWVEFHLADGSSSRERLTWISPQRGLLVFSNHQGQRAIQIAREDLADLVHERKAILIFDQPRRRIRQEQRLGDCHERPRIEQNRIDQRHHPRSQPRLARGQ